MTTQPRNLRMGIFKFRTTPCGKLPTDADLRRTIRKGVSGTAMPTFAEMSDSDLSSIIVFIQNLSRRWQDEKYYANPIALPSVPDWISKDSVNTQRADKGKTLFTQMCITCHGEDGSGNGPASKGLVDVWENSITPATLTAPHLKSGDRPEDLYRTIATGLDGTPMVGFNDALKTEQIWELVEFIRSLKPTNQQR